MSDEYVWFEGIPFPFVGFSPEHLRDIKENFVLKDEDVLILTFPKSGTNWLIEIICLIYSKGGTKWIQSVPIWERSPWLETSQGYKFLKDKEGPRLMTSHLPIHLFPKSVFKSKAKLIYLLRNPRDVLVSGYFFWTISNLVKKPESLEQYLDWFIRGNVAFGSWFDHTRGWLSMREKENFLMLSYEELKRDTRNTVQKLCQFLGKKLEPDELNSLLEHSSFQVMKENKMSNYTLMPSHILDHKSGSFMRKGISGDWKTYFTVAQAEVFDKVFEEKMADLPQELFPWK
ncbi:bile salt sulfotransferase [Pteropus vampyrus]|uniref:Sulfotransferase n=1 Tax=Pteropus vampyrus TaxID=132908 RepID=A0A6P3R750_PTEVA|nr:bile salt sulfotransferase [Pteropus vampyrus]